MANTCTVVGLMGLSCCLGVHPAVRKRTQVEMDVLKGAFFPSYLPVRGRERQPPSRSCSLFCLFQNFKFSLLLFEVVLVKVAGFCVVCSSCVNRRQRKVGDSRPRTFPLEIYFHEVRIS